MSEIYVFYGDSNTYGYDPRSMMGDRYPQDVRWTGILQKETGWDIRNHGICGRCIPHTASQIHFACEQIQDWAAEASTEDNTVNMWIMLGSNDLLQEHTFTAEDVADRMKCFMEKVLQQPAVRKGIVKPGLIVPAVMEYGAWVDTERLYEESRKFDSAYSSVADTLKIPFIRTDSWDIPVVFDGVHFSEEGHRNFAKLFISNIPTGVLP